MNNDVTKDLVLSCKLQLVSHLNIQIEEHMLMWVTKWKKLHECLKLQEDTFARSHFCTRRQNCTKIKLQEDYFAQRYFYAEIFLHGFIYKIYIYIFFF